MEVIELNSNEEGVPRISDSDGGKRARRVFYVGAIDPAVALIAPGVPRKGDPFSSNDPVPARTIEAVPAAGYDDPASSRVGWTRVTVDYQTEPLTLGGITPNEQLTFTQFEFSTNAVQVFQDVDGAQISNGEGANKQIGVLTANVTQFRNGFSLTDWINLKDRTNADAVLLPNPFNVAGSVQAGVGTLLALAPRVVETSELSLLSVTWRFAVAADHLFRWRKIDADGQPVGPVIASQIYESTTFADKAGLTPA